MNNILDLLIYEAYCVEYGIVPVPYQYTCKPAKKVF